MTLHCQICAETFVAQDAGQRFCSQTCWSAFQRARPRRYRKPMQIQARVLDALRAQNGAEIARRDLAQIVYGDAGDSSVNAIHQVIWRLRHCWESSGLEIGARVIHRHYERRAETYYRLTADIVPANDEVAS